MHEVMVAGAGKIGSLIATLLATSEDYRVHLADINAKPFDLEGKPAVKIELAQLDVRDKKAFKNYVTKHRISTVISCLPFYCNRDIAEHAKDNQLHYFDLTEDVNTSEKIAALAVHTNNVFVPQCGLAPGFISIVANDLMKRFDQVSSVRMRVGALPLYPNNALKYALTWSTDGLINEYGNVCYAIVNGKKTPLQPLEGLEYLTIDGTEFEAFNTSGGLGTLATTYQGKIKTLNYKTLRYPGHCQYMRFLMNDLGLNEDRDTLKRILESAIPRSGQDMAMIYVSVNGDKSGQFVEEVYTQKIMGQVIAGKWWSAIQVATAASACAVVDLVLEQQPSRSGLILQESVQLSDFMNNRFGQYYQTDNR